jgi:hypothetical protein
MQIISQGNNYIVQFDLYSDLTNIANNVIGNLTYNNTQLTLVSMTVTPTIGTQSTLNTNQYLFGTVFPNKHYTVACVFTVLQESNLIPITWTISTSNPETTLANNSKTINLVDYLDGLLASDICANLQGCVVTARTRFLEVLPSGEWLWENYNPANNAQLSTFTTPAPGAQIITSADSSITVVGSDLSVTHTVNPDGSVTLNDGTVISAPIPETITTIVNNGNGTATYTNEAGIPITFPIGGVTAVDNSDGTYTLTLADGSTVTISDTSTSTMVNNLDGTYTYTDETGVTTTFSTIDVTTTVTNTVAGNKIADYTNELGVVVAINETVTSIVNNSDGTATYTDESGTSITFPIGGATLVDNGNGTITYTSESGTVTTFDEGFTSFVNSANGFTATYPNGSTYVWSETITALVAATDGFSYTSENGTVTTVTYLFDNATPASPNLLVQVNGTTQASIPLNSYDVNISTSGGFTFNPTTDEITITETDGETHIIDLTPLRTTLTSVDNSVQVVSSVNPDGSTNYDLGVKAHTNQIESVVYTGTELPSIAGVNIGDTTDAQFLNGTVVSYTWDGTTWVQDFEQTWGEQRICLNTVAPAFTPTDVNNPTVAEVDAWAIANLTIQQRENGTKLVYFVAGDGGSCDVPDYEWTLNKGSQLVTLSNKRVFNTKTVYVDAGSGSDVTGRRGYREFPFKTLNEGITAALEGDLLYVFPGDYIQSTPITKWINIHCENGVDWLLQSNFSVATDFALAKTVNWKFDVIRQVTYGQYSTRPLNTLGGYNLTINTAEKVFFYSATKNRTVKVNKSINSAFGIQSIGATNAQGTNEIENAEWDYTQGNTHPLFNSQNSNDAQVSFYCKNLKSINSSIGGFAPTIGYYFAFDIGTGKCISTIVDNVLHDDPNIYSTPAGTLAGIVAWRGPGAFASVYRGLFLVLPNSIQNNSQCVVDINNIKSTGFGCLIRPSDIQDVKIVVNISGDFKKGIPLMTTHLNTLQNSTIVFNLNVECHTSMGLFLGFVDGAASENNIHPSNTVIVTGRIKTKQAGYPCISIGQGSAASNNTNGTILLKDLTLINDGTVSPIMCAVPENVVIQNVKTNSLITDVNIVEVAESITRNSNYK